MLELLEVSKENLLAGRKGIGANGSSPSAGRNQCESGLVRGASSHGQRRSREPHFCFAG